MNLTQNSRICEGFKNHTLCCNKFHALEESDEDKEKEGIKKKSYKDAVINTLCATEDPEIHNTVQAGEWEKVTFTIDSGANENVCNKNIGKNVHIKESTAQKRGIQYEMASVQRVINAGDKVFRAHTDAGVCKTTTSQIAAVNRALLNVDKIVRNGHEVHFENGRNYIRDCKSGAIIDMQRNENGMYTVDMRIKPSGGFPRQETQP